MWPLCTPLIRANTFFYLTMGQKSLIKDLFTSHLPYVVDMIASSCGPKLGMYNMKRVNHCITEQQSSAFMNNQGNTRL